MADNLDLLNTTVFLVIRAALLAARFSGRVRQRYLNCLASRDVDAKAKEILFLKDRVYQLEMQLSPQWLLTNAASWRFTACPCRPTVEGQSSITYGA
jgi:hypothetical protein